MTSAESQNSPRNKISPCCRRIYSFCKQRGLKFTCWSKIAVGYLIVSASVIYPPLSHCSFLFAFISGLDAVAKQTIKSRKEKCAVQIKRAQNCIWNSCPLRAESQCDNIYCNYLLIARSHFWLAIKSHTYTQRGTQLSNNAFISLITTSSIKITRLFQILAIKYSSAKYIKHDQN